MFLLLTLKRFNILSLCLHRWLRTSECRLGTNYKTSQRRQWSHVKAVYDIPHCPTGNLVVVSWHSFCWYFANDSTGPGVFRLYKLVIRFYFYIGWSFRSIMGWSGLKEKILWNSEVYENVMMSWSRKKIYCVLVKSWHVLYPFNVKLSNVNEHTSTVNYLG